MMNEDEFTESLERLIVVSKLQGAIYTLLAIVFGYFLQNIISWFKLQLMLYI